MINSLKSISLEKEIYISNLINLALFSTTIALLLILISPQESISCSKIECVSNIFHFELFLAIMQVIVIYIFDRAKREI